MIISLYLSGFKSLFHSRFVAVKNWGYSVINGAITQKQDKGFLSQMLLVIFLRRIALHTRHNSGVLLSQKTNKGKDALRPAPIAQMHLLAVVIFHSR